MAAYSSKSLEDIALAFEQRAAMATRYAESTTSTMLQRDRLVWKVEAQTWREAAAMIRATKMEG